MIKINFNLRDAKAKGKTSIIMVCYYSGVRLKMSTGVQITPKEWNDSKQFIRETQENPTAFASNKRLNLFRKSASESYEDFYTNNENPTTTQLKNKIKEKLSDDIKIDQTKDFWYHFERFVETKKKKVKDVRDYNNALRKHLIEVEKLINEKLSYTIIKPNNGVFYNVWEDYLRNRAVNSSGEKGLRLNTIGKQNKNLKAFLNWSFRESITSHFNLSHYPTYQEERDSIYLTESELETIRDIKLKDEFNQKVRDLFVIACRTGMRFSDFRNISPDSINQSTNRIKYKSRKTKQKIEVPIHPDTHAIIKRYNGELPKFDNRELTDYNKALREIGERARVNGEVSINDSHRGIDSVKKIKKYNLISSHTGRRTFCTLAYLKGIDSQLIMKISGHKSERNFMKYLKLDNELAANEFEKQWLVDC